MSKADKLIEEARKGAGDMPADVELLREEVRRLRKRVRAGAGTADLILAAMREHLDTHPIRLKPIPKPKSDRRTSHEEIAVIHYSDAQFGKVTNSYDSGVATERALMLAQKSVEITDIRRTAAPFRECRLYLGGDIVEGETIFPHQPFLIDSPLLDQACGAAPTAIARMVRHLLANFDRVRVIAVPGNHGRNGRFNHPKTNWDIVACRVAQLMLSDANGKLLPRLEFECSDTFYTVDRVFEWGNLVVHGHQIRGGFAGFPFYGVGKKASGWADSINEPWDYLWFGHFHTMTSGTLNHRNYLANGTTESDNEYALEELAAAGWPVQRLAFFTAHHGMISDNPIWLTNARRSQAQRWADWTAKR